MTPPSPKLISVIIPVLNEEENLPLLLDKIHELRTETKLPIEVIVVNDGSTDSTPSRADSFAKEHDDVRVVHFRRNYGQTAAFMAGVDHSRGDVLIPVDGDLQNDVRDIPLLLEKLAEGYDVVSGWRKDRHDALIKRVLLSNAANWLISTLSGVRLHDYGCTLKAYRRFVFDDVRLYGEMHRFIPIYAKWNGARITELPVRHHARKAGSSKYGLERVIKVFLDLLVVLFLHRYLQRPMYVFGTCGILSFATSGAAFLWMLYYKVAGLKTFIETPLPLLTVVMFFLGVICFLLGLIAELILRTYHESQNRKTYSVASVTQGPQALDS